MAQNSIAQIIQKIKNPPLRRILFTIEILYHHAVNFYLSIF